MYDFVKYYLKSMVLVIKPETFHELKLNIKWYTHVIRPDLLNQVLEIQFKELVAASNEVAS